MIRRIPGQSGARRSLGYAGDGQSARRKPNRTANRCTRRPLERTLDKGEGRTERRGAQMFGAGWVWPVLAGIGLIVVLAALELLSVAIATIGETGEAIDRSVETKRAA